MKILQINSVCGIGSTGRIATDLHSVLKEKEYESYIAYGRGKAINCDKTIRIGSKTDNYVHVLQTRLFDRHGLGSYKATKKFINQIDRIDPDIIHLHNIHGYYINIEILFKYIKKTRKPVIWTLHDCWSFTGHCAYFDYIGCEKWKTECNKCTQRNQYPKTIGLDNSKYNYVIKKELFTGIENMTLVTPSRWLAKLAEKSFLGEYKIEVINNGIDLDNFKPTKGNFREVNRLEEKFIILGVANVWEQRKGYEYFIQLARQLHQDEQIVLVGVTEKQKRKLPPNIVGINRTNNVRELAEIYSEANVFINPTLEDNFPTTNLEALACGTPIIAFDTGGTGECINDRCGIALEEKNTNQIIQSIRELKNKGFTRKDCLEAAKKYDKKQRYNEYIKMYEGIYSNK